MRSEPRPSSSLAWLTPNSSGRTQAQGGRSWRQITGTPQSDNLVGTIDNDTITGFAGHDISTGGDGGDRFIYQRLSDLSVCTGSVLPWHETITDFGEHGSVIEDEQDVLDFSALSSFLFIGDDEFSATGQNEYRFQRHRALYLYCADTNSSLFPHPPYDETFPLRLPKRTSTSRSPFKAPS